MEDELQAIHVGRNIINVNQRIFFGIVIKRDNLTLIATILISYTTVLRRYCPQKFSCGCKSLVCHTLYNSKILLLIVSVNSNKLNLMEISVELSFLFPSLFYLVLNHLLLREMKRNTRFYNLLQLTVSKISKAIEYRITLL